MKTILVFHFKPIQMHKIHLFSHAMHTFTPFTHSQREEIISSSQIFSSPDVPKHIYDLFAGTPYPYWPLSVTSYPQFPSCRLAIKFVGKPLHFLFNQSLWTYGLFIFTVPLSTAIFITMLQLLIYWGEDETLTGLIIFWVKISWVLIKAEWSEL